MPLFFKRKKYEDRNKLMVESHVVENLTTKYFARRLECKSQMAGCCLYKGIVYRADSGFAQNGMEYFFNQGFRQRDVAIEWDTFTGRKARGHTGSVGISTTYNYTFAEEWRAEDIYIIDLSNHPMALDVNYSAKRKLDDMYQVDTYQCEINVANSIHPEMIFGHYNSVTKVLTKNPAYEGMIVL